MTDETQPLLGSTLDNLNKHQQYCGLVGVVPSNHPPTAKRPRPHPSSLYERAKRKRTSTNITYTITATLSNTLLLSQVVLGAALTALGASSSSHVLITIFGALNTIIAGMVAYLKSRGQPMRARMFRDDLERVVAEIENSEIMWMGISHDCHGYSDIDTDDDVSVRSEVARLTKLYDRAIRNNTMNNPDMYMAASGADAFTQLRARAMPGQSNLPAAVPASASTPPAAAATASSGATKPVPAADKGETKETTPANASESKSTAATINGADTAEVQSQSNTDADKEDRKASESQEVAGAQVHAADATPQQPEPAAGVPLTNDVDEGPVTNVSQTRKKHDDE
ncbi:MAG: hypothetical protein Q9159_007125 [Coniocarpon cinnabarinum]